MKRNCVAHPSSRTGARLSSKETLQVAEWESSSLSLNDESFAGRDDAPLWTRWEFPIRESMRRNERRRLLSDAMMTKQGAEE